VHAQSGNAGAIWIGFIGSGNDRPKLFDYQPGLLLPMLARNPAPIKKDRQGI
jgi:hypothetical protein